MKALILAAGFGSRLGNLTSATPKALVPVGGRAILDHSIRKLLKAEVTDILINTHYLSQQVEDFLSRQPYRNLVTTVHEDELLGTAGTVSGNWDWFNNEDFLVMHGDNYFEADLDTLVAKHANRYPQTDMTMATFTAPNPANCGTVDVDANDVVVDFYEKDPSSHSLRANAAIYIFSPNLYEIFRSLSREENDISRHVVPRLLGRIQAHHLQGDFFDIGTAEGLQAASQSHLTHRENL